MTTLPTAFPDSAIRFAAFGILVLLSGLLLRDARQGWAGRATAAFTASVAAYLLCSHAPVREGAGVFLPLLYFFCLGGPFFLWFAAQAIFIDDFKPRFPQFASLVAIEVFGFTSIALQGEASLWALLAVFLHHAVMIALYVHALYVAWRSYGDDLIESRREFRRLFIGSVAALGCIIAGVEITFAGRAVPAGLETTAAAAILVLTFALALLAIRIDPIRLFLAAPAEAGRQPPARTEPLSAGDRHSLGLVRKAIEDDRLYRKDGLTISALAETVNAPEHHLRRIINAGLGYRNFNAFLNHYRIDEVKTALADPARARIPILTLALDAGYGSLAPFNRAFKERVGLTPSAYRKLKLGSGENDDMPAG